MNNSLLINIQSDHNDHTYVAHQVAEFLAYRGYTNVNLLATHSIDEVETMMLQNGHPIEHPQRGDSMWLGHDRHIVVAMEEPRNNNETRMVHYVPIRDLSPLWLPAMPSHEFDDPDFGKEKPAKDDLKVLQALINMTSLGAVMAFIKDAVAHGESLDVFLKHVQARHEADKRSFFSTGETVVTEAGLKLNEAMSRATGGVGGFINSGAAAAAKVAARDGILSDASVLAKDFEGDSLNGLVLDPQLAATAAGLFTPPSLDELKEATGFISAVQLSAGSKLTSEHGGRGTAVPVTEDADPMENDVTKLDPWANDLSAAQKLRIWYHCKENPDWFFKNVARMPDTIPKISSGDGILVLLPRPASPAETDPNAPLHFGQYRAGPVETDKGNVWMVNDQNAGHIQVEGSPEAVIAYLQGNTVPGNKYGPLSVVIHTQFNEPFFVLLGRDPQAPDLVDQWAADRNQMEMGNPKVAQAMDIANLMRQFKTTNPQLGMSQNLYEESLAKELMFLVPRQKPYTEEEILEMAMVITNAAMLSGVELNISHNTCFTHIGKQQMVDQQLGNVSKIVAELGAEVIILKYENGRLFEAWGSEEILHKVIHKEALAEATVYKPGEYRDMHESDMFEIQGLNVMDRNLDEMQSIPRAD